MCQQACDGQVGCAPFEGEQLLRLEPAACGMLAHDELPVACCAAIGSHGDVEVGIVVSNGDQVLMHVDVIFHLFEQLAVQGLLGCLAGLDFASRKLPMSGGVGVSGVPLLHAQDQSLVLNDRCNNMDHSFLDFRL